MRLHLLARAVLLRQSAAGVSVLLTQEIGTSHTFLPGGHADPGEGLTTALVRELDEELGLSVTVRAYLGAVEHQWPAAVPAHYEVNHVFLVESTGDARLPDAPVSRESHLRFLWRPVDALAAYHLQPTPLQQLLTQYVAGDTTAWWASTLPTDGPGRSG
jgi:8-oxo-dGTP diphosphatase